MIVLQNWQEERLPITYRNFCHKSLLRLKSKFLNWQGSQPTRYKVKLSLNQKYNRTYENIPGETKVRPIFIPWNALNGKQVTLQLTWMTFLQNREVFFNQERLPMTYPYFRHKSLVRLKSKCPNWQGPQPITYKANFSQKECT